MYALSSYRTCLHMKWSGDEARAGDEANTHTHVCTSLCTAGADSWIEWCPSCLSTKLHSRYHTTSTVGGNISYLISSHPSSLSSYWYHCCFYSMLCHLLHPLLSFPLYCHLQGSVYHCWRTSTGQMYPQDYSHSVHYFITAANMTTLNTTSSWHYVHLIFLCALQLVQ